MQIRLGNRQDEPAITAVVNEVMEEFGLTPQPKGSESDLTNIEAKYFGKDGLFLVAEENKQIIGVAGARANSAGQLTLVRIAVKKDHRRKGVAQELMETIIRFAKDMEYERIEVEPARQYPSEDKAFMRWGFSSPESEDSQKVWYLKV